MSVISNPSPPSRGGPWRTIRSALGIGSLADWLFLQISLSSALLAMLLAVPLGVGTATFLAEVAPAWLRRSGSFLVELLAAIPSVVYGFWGVAFLAPNVQRMFA